MKCGRAVPVKQRGAHAALVCQTPWNAGRGLEDPRIARVAAMHRGTKRPEASALMSSLWQNQEWRTARVARMSEGQRKRFSRPEEVAASRKRALGMVRDGKIIPFGGRLHGKGKPPTVSETELRRRLEPHGFVAELIIGTGSRGPSYYAIDLAHEDRKLAVEIDGSSHLTAARWRSDERKTSFLTSRGWQVLRFREPVDCNRVAQMCIELIST